MALSSREIILILRARDEASRVLHGFSKNINGLSKQAIDAANASYAHGQALVTAGVAVAGAGALAIVALNGMTDAAIAYNQEAGKTLTQVDGLNLSLEDIKKMGRDLATSVPVDFGQVQGALYDIFSSIDTDAPGAAILLKGIGKAAVAGSVDMETAGRVNLAILNAWKMKAGDVNKVNDVMFQLVRKGVGTYDQFGKSIGRAIPSAIRAGQSVESLAGMMAFLTRNGLSTSMSASSAARALDALSNPKTVTKFKEWGVALTDSKGKFRPVVDIIADMKDKLEKLSPAARSAKLQELFKGSGGTIQAMRFFNLALADSNNMLPELTQNMKDAGGASDAAYKIMSQTPQAKLQLLNNQWQVMSTVLGDQLLPIKMAIVDFFSKLLGWFNQLSPATQGWIVKILAAVAALTVILGIVMSAVGLFMMFSAAVTLAGFTLGGVVAVIGGVVLAIAALVAIGVLVYKNWDLIKQKAGEVWNYIQPVVMGIVQAIIGVAKVIWDSLGQVWRVIGPEVIAGWNMIWGAISSTITNLQPYWDQLVAAFELLRTKAGEVASGFIDWFSRLWTVVQPILYMIGAAFQILWSIISQVFVAIWNAAVSFIGNVIQVFAGLINFITAVFTGNWKAAWDAVVQILKGIWGAISALFVGARDLIWGIVEGFIRGVIGFFQNLWNVLVGHSIVPDMINAIVSWFLSLPGKIFGHLASFVSGIVNKFISLATQVGQQASRLVSGAVGWFLLLPGRAISAVAPLASRMLAQGISWLQNALNGVRSIWPGLSNFFTGLPGRIVSGLGNLGSLLWNAGVNVMQGFLNGLRSMWGNVTGFVSGIGSWIADHKGPKSYDLKLLVPAGRWIMTGLRHGLRKEIPGLQRELNGVASIITSTPFGTAPVGFGGRPPFGGPGGSGPGAPAVEVNIHTQEINPVKTGAELGYEIAGRLGL